MNGDMMMDGNQGGMMGDFQKMFEDETGWKLINEPYSSAPFKSIMPDGKEAGYYDYAHRCIEWMESNWKKAVVIHEHRGKK